MFVLGFKASLTLIRSVSIEANKHSGYGSRIENITRTWILGRFCFLLIIYFCFFTTYLRDNECAETNNIMGTVIKYAYQKVTRKYMVYYYFK